jgi:hypothetical protein
VHNIPSVNDLDIHTIPTGVRVIKSPLSEARLKPLVAPSIPLDKNSFL